MRLTIDLSKFLSVQWSLLIDLHTSNQYVIMAVQIESFHSAQNFYLLMFSSNLRSVIIISPLIICFLSMAAYSFKAQTVAEFAQVFYIFITQLCIIIDFVTICWKIENVNQLVQKYEEFIEKSGLPTLVTLSSIIFQSSNDGIDNLDLKISLQDH